MKKSVIMMVFGVLAAALISQEIFAAKAGSAVLRPRRWGNPLFGNTHAASATHTL